MRHGRYLIDGGFNGVIGIMKTRHGKKVMKDCMQINCKVFKDTLKRSEIKNRL